MECVDYEGYAFTSSVWVDGVKNGLEPILVEDARRDGEEIKILGCVPEACENHDIKEHLTSTQPNDCFIAYFAAAENRKTPQPRSYWSELNEDFPADAVSQRMQVLEHVKTQVVESEGSILDVGCGDGKLLSMLARQKPGLTLWGVDANKKCIMKAKKALGNKANILYGDAQELSYFLPEKDFDVVTAIGILDTQVTTREESLKILAAIHDIMGKNGLFIAVPYTMPTITHEEIQKKYEIHKKTVPQNFFTHNEPKDVIIARKTS